MEMAKQIVQAHKYNKRQIDAMKDNGKQIDTVNARPKKQERPTKCRHRDETNRKRDKVHDKETICSHCGYKKHSKKDCPAMGQNCNKCQKLNHFAKMCKSQHDSKSSVHLVQNLEDYAKSDSSEEEFYVYTVSGSSRSDQALVRLTICNSNLDAKIDTGSQVNILPHELLKRLNINAPMLPPPDSRLTSYSGDTLTLLGKMKLRCRFEDRSTQATFYIVDQKKAPALINLETAHELGL